MERRRGWGILGTCKIARIIARAIRDSTGGTLAAVASRSADRATEFASAFGPAKHYVGYPTLLSDPDVEIVYVATHHPVHLECAVAAAEAGKHVLCEKPLALTAEGASQIVSAAQRSGVFLMEAFAYRCHPQTSWLAELLRNGDIGEVRMIAAVLTFPGGIMARVASATQVNLDSTLRIYDSTGTITVPSPWLPGRNGAPSLIVVEPTGSSPREIRIDSGVDPYVREVDAVSRLVAEGCRSHPLMGWQESLANMSTLDRWRHCAGVDYQITEHQPHPGSAAARPAASQAGARAEAP